MKTEEMVRRATEKMNFQPNLLARGLRLHRTLTIGLLVPDIANPYFSQIAKYTEMAARQSGYGVLLCDSEGNTELEAESLALLQRRNVDGLIIAPVGQSARYIKELQNGRLPVVAIDRRFPRLKLPYVISDNYKGALEATSYLVNHGHQTIACVQGLAGTAPNQERVRGYRASLKRHGISASESSVMGSNFGVDNGYIHTKLLLNERKDITAILALSNLIALGALGALAEEGLRVPEDISIITFDDQPYSAYLGTPMTVVDQDKRRMGNVAMQLLLEQIQSPDSFRKSGVVLPTTFIERASVKHIGKY